MAGEFPVLASIFGEDNIEPCLELMRAFFEKPPLFGPRAVFLVYEPGTLENPLETCRALESEVSAAMPEGTACPFKAAMKGDPGFGEIAKDVLWFDLSTGEAFPPEQRKLGFKNAKAAAPAPAEPRPPSAPPPGIGLDDSDVPTLVIGNPERRAKKNKPFPVMQILKGAFGAVALVIASIYAFKFFDKDSKPKTPAKRPPAARQEQASGQGQAAQPQAGDAAAGDSAQPAAAQSPGAQNAKPAPGAPQTAEAADNEPPKQAEPPAELLKQNPFPAGRGPRLFSELTDALHVRTFAWAETATDDVKPSAQPAGSVWWCAFPEDPAAKSANATIYRITMNEKDGRRIPEIMLIANGKEAGTVPAAELKKLRRERPHVEIFEENAFIHAAPPETFAKDYEPPVNASFSPAKIDFGEGLYAMLQSAGRGAKAKTGGLEWDVMFTYCDPKPLGFTATFDRDVTYRDILAEIRNIRDGIVREMRDQAQAAADARAAAGKENRGGRGARNDNEESSNHSFSGGRQGVKSFGGARSGFGGAKSGFGGARSGFGGSKSGGYAQGRPGLGAGSRRNNRPADAGANGDADKNGGNAAAGAKPKSALQAAEDNASNSAIERDILAGKIKFKRRIPR